MELQRQQTTREPMDDEKIVGLYWERDEKAIEETDFKYKKYLFSIAYNVVHDRLDCEECLNDTYLGAWNTMPPSKPSVLKALQRSPHPPTPRALMLSPFPRIAERAKTIFGSSYFRTPVFN